VWQPCELLYTCYLLTYLLVSHRIVSFKCVHRQLAMEMHGTYCLVVVRLDGRIPGEATALRLEFFIRPLALVSASNVGLLSPEFGLI